MIYLQFHQQAHDAKQLKSPFAVPHKPKAHTHARAYLEPDERFCPASQVTTHSQSLFRGGRTQQSEAASPKTLTGQNGTDNTVRTKW